MLRLANWCLFLGAAAAGTFEPPEVSEDGFDDDGGYIEHCASSTENVTVTFRGSPTPTYRICHANDAKWWLNASVAGCEEVGESSYPVRKLQTRGLHWFAAISEAGIALSQPFSCDSRRSIEMWKSGVVGVAWREKVQLVCSRNRGRFTWLFYAETCAAPADFVAARPVACEPQVLTDWQTNSLVTNETRQGGLYVCAASDTKVATRLTVKQLTFATEPPRRAAAEQDALHCQAQADAKTLEKPAQLWLVNGQQHSASEGEVLHVAKVCAGSCVVQCVIWTESAGIVYYRMAQTSVYQKLDELTQFGSLRSASASASVATFDVTMTSIVAANYAFVAFLFCWRWRRLRNDAVREGTFLWLCALVCEILLTLRVSIVDYGIADASWNVCQIFAAVSALLFTCGHVIMCMCHEWRRPATRDGGNSADSALALHESDSTASLHSSLSSLEGSMRVRARDSIDRHELSFVKQERLKRWLNEASVEKRFTVAQWIAD